MRRILEQAPQTFDQVRIGGDDGVGFAASGNRAQVGVDDGRSLGKLFMFSTSLDKSANQYVK